MPDAVQALTGLDMSAHVNQAHPLHQVLDTNRKPWPRMSKNAADDHQRIAVLEQFCRPAGKRFAAKRSAKWTRSAPGCRLF
ncbi:MAG: hypothetical protein IPJ18_00140 [Betaproteobacteria bacterium]|nr:hypothetical protein [Betaproteobacteria bacterium]